MDGWRQRLSPTLHGSDQDFKLLNFMSCLNSHDRDDELVGLPGAFWWYDATYDKKDYANHHRAGQAFRTIHIHIHIHRMNFPFIFLLFPIFPIFLLFDDRKSIGMCHYTTDRQCIVYNVIAVVLSTKWFRI
jgi:hypothetical protein